jgi:tetratricopeptide (TPR) repeat protein
VPDVPPQPPAALSNAPPDATAAPGPARNAERTLTPVEMLDAAYRLLAQAESYHNPEKRVGPLQEAAKLLWRVRVEAPGDARALLGLGEAFRMSGQPAQAREMYVEFIASPEGRNNYKAYQGLGDVFLQSKYYRQALPKFQRAVRLNANSEDAQRGLAESLWGLRRYAEAYDAIEKARRVDPNDVEALRVHALICLQWTAPNPPRPEWQEEGLKACNRALSILHARWEEAPRDTYALSQMVEFCQLIKDLTQRQIQAALQATPNGLQPDMVLRHIEARQNEAWFTQMLEDHKSLNFIEEGLSLFPEHVALLEKAAKLQKMLNLRDDALQTCERLLAVDPDNGTAQNIMQELTAQASTVP